MAEQKTIDKVKELIESNAYAPLKEAAEKWLASADEKYGDKFDSFKEKAGDIAEDVRDKAEELAGKAAPVIGDLKEKADPYIDKIQEKAAPYVDELKEKADPYIDKIQEKAAPYVDEIKGKAAPVVDKISDSEFAARLKESIATLTENIEFFGSDLAKEKFGAEAAAQIKEHAEKLKAEGKTYCDCPACTKAREILKDLGEEIEP